MKKPVLLRFFLLLAVVAGSLLGSGCASTNEPQNQSSRPWNQPRGWESGVPGLLQNDRRY